MLPAPDRSALNETFAQPGVLAQALAYYRQLFSPPSDAAAQALEALASGPIAVPSLYLHGSEDGCISARLSEGMEAVFTRKCPAPGMTTRSSPLVHLEQPEAVFDHVLRFLRS